MFCLPFRPVEWKIGASTRLTFRDSIEIPVLRGPTKGIPSEIKMCNDSRFELCICSWKFKWFRLLNLKAGCFGGEGGIFDAGLRWIFQAACDLFWRWRSRNRLRGRGNWQFAAADDERFENYYRREHNSFKL